MNNYSCIQPWPSKAPQNQNQFSPNKAIPNHFDSCLDILILLSAYQDRLICTKHQSIFYFQYSFCHQYLSHTNIYIFKINIKFSPNLFCPQKQHNLAPRNGSNAAITCSVAAITYRYATITCTTLKPTTL